MLGIREGKYTKKDRIIQNEVYEVLVEFAVADSTVRWRHEARYAQALRRLVEGNRRVSGVWEWASVRSVAGGRILLTVVG